MSEWEQEFKRRQTMQDEQRQREEDELAVAFGEALQMHRDVTGSMETPEVRPLICWLVGQVKLLRASVARYQAADARLAGKTTFTLADVKRAAGGTG